MENVIFAHVAMLHCMAGSDAVSNQSPEAWSGHCRNAMSEKYQIATDPTTFSFLILPLKKAETSKKQIHW